MSNDESRDLLKALCEIFAECGVEFFADSGTLLGIARTGDLISGDSDMDIGLVNFDESALGAIRERCLVQGIIVREKTYLGKVHALSFEQMPPSNALNVHAHIYFEHGDYYLAPQVVKFRKPEFWPQGAKYLLASRAKLERICLAEEFRLHDLSVRSVMERTPTSPFQATVASLGMPLYLAWYHGHLHSKQKRVPGYGHAERYIFLGRKRSRKFVSSFTWVVPKQLFKSTSLVDFFGSSVRVPSQYKEYLSLRYGERWETPNSDWIYFLDDGLLYAAEYEFLVPRLHTEKTVLPPRTAT